MILIEYDGAFPNLCSGSLVVTIEGKRWNFPRYCLESGGRVWFDEDWREHVESGPWGISEWPEDFPLDSKLRDEVIDEVNSIIPQGCCGGCV